ncbi:hypothetical protein KFE25_001460 [Diacronema lutheri]|uniref:Uncharacterized protein n=1 Tax=Diacronema lutheri TaxID=2081491 RepID=A0A7R9UWK7_DIALT|nr:hypothetical protein KFE25_001460 [Diacronema lutheri]|mmetsp:Transcript_7523/g.23802  ORF Transcript_7523/g.23802 Transcript_7523/m.23802 type:complete len:109 (+) Transcript_7523:119-445(+)
MHQEEQNAEEVAQGMVLAYFDGDRPVFRSAALAISEDDDAIQDDEPVFSYSAGLPRNVAYEIEDDEPVYRSLGALTIGTSAPSPDMSAPAPPSLCRQRGFGQPGLCDC